MKPRRRSLFRLFLCLGRDAGDLRRSGSLAGEQPELGRLRYGYLGRLNRPCDCSLRCLRRFFRHLQIEGQVNRRLVKGDHRFARWLWRQLDIRLRAEEWPGQFPGIVALGETFQAAVKSAHVGERLVALLPVPGKAIGHGLKLRIGVHQIEQAMRRLPQRRPFVIGREKSIVDRFIHVERNMDEIPTAVAVRLCGA